MKEDYYGLLGVSTSAPVEVISAAYKVLLKQHHPDLAIDETDRKKRESVSKALGEAHAILSDPVARGRYDQELKLHAGNNRFDQPDFEEKEKNKESNYSASASEIYEEYLRSENNKQQQVSEAGFKSPNGEFVEVYDDLMFISRRRLLIFALADKQWRKFRRLLLKNRPRIGGLPAGWFASKPAQTPNSVKRGESLKLKMIASWKIAVIAATIWCAFAIIAVILWSRTWYQTFAQEQIGSIWFVPLIVVPVQTLVSIIIPSALLLMMWVRRYGGWFNKVDGARARVGVYATLLTIILMIAPLLITPIIGSLIIAGVLGAVALRG